MAIFGFAGASTSTLGPGVQEGLSRLTRCSSGSLKTSALRVLTTQTLMGRPSACFTNPRDVGFPDRLTHRQDKLLPLSPLHGRQRFPHEDLLQLAKPLSKRKKRHIPLTQREKLFIKEYLIDQNGTRSVKAAGYTQNDHSAAIQSCILLRKSRILVPIARELKAREDRVQFRADDVLRQIKNISDADIAECYLPSGELKNLHDIPINIRKCIAGVETKEVWEKVDGRMKLVGYTKKLKFWDKTKALEMYGRHYKLFTDKLALGGPNGEPLPTQQCVIVLPAKDQTTTKE